jgi:hypothetical protein
MNPRLLFATLALAASATATVVTGAPGAAHAAPSPEVAGATTAAAGRVVLGSPRHYAPNGIGWGTATPSQVFNGGDPAGDVSRITWDRWGQGRAYGHGLTSAFRPGGGYYRKPVRIVLRAGGLGACADGTRPAYTRLFFREQPRPGAPLQRHWHPWTTPTGNICSRY